MLFDGTRKGNYAYEVYSFTPPSSYGSGITEVPDPTGLNRTVLRFALHENDGDGSVVRAQLQSPRMHNAGDTIWIYDEVYFPGDFPSLPSGKWLTLGSHYGPPYDGNSPAALTMDNVNGQNVFEHQHNGTYGWQVMWQSPATRSVWHRVARKIKLSEDPNVGYMEVYTSAKGNPLVKQAFNDGTTRKYFKTLDSSNNGGANDTRINQYRGQGYADFQGKLAALYHAAYRVYDGTATAAEIEAATGSDTSKLRVSNSADRSNPVDLAGATLKGNRYVFAADETGTSQVKFWLDDPARTGSPVQTENYAPWDFAGGGDLTANALDTTTLSEGNHTISVTYTMSDGRTINAEASFTVDNVP